jgi:hypothetical protein
MAQPTFTTKSQEPLKNELSPAPSDATKLDLPAGGDYDPEPERADPRLAMRLCEVWAPIVRARPGFWERREAERCPAEFDLADPTRVQITYAAEFIDDLLRRQPWPNSSLTEK